MAKYRSIALERHEGADNSCNITKSDMAWIKTELERLGFAVEMETVKTKNCGYEKIDKETILKNILSMAETKETKNTLQEANLAQ